MSPDGKRLEDLVTFVEKILLPKGFDVRTNDRVFNDEGIQIAEFDVEVRGKVGTTNLAWLIECRDRPSSGPAPGSWIEQLVGRRRRFGFNKVTAVSTTGFSAGAIEFAESSGIELRQVDSLSPNAFSSWLGTQRVTRTVNLAFLKDGCLVLGEEEPVSRQGAVSAVLLGATLDHEILRSVKTNKPSSLTNAFLSVVQSQDMFNGIAPNGGAKAVKLRVEYTNDDDHFVIDTDVGAVRVEAIEFSGGVIGYRVVSPDHYGC